jgi:hypothetical protein
MYLRRELCDRGADRELRPFEPLLEDLRAVTHEHERGAVVCRSKGGDIRDAGSAGVREQFTRERRADAAVLVAVGTRSTRRASATT